MVLSFGNWDDPPPHVGKNSQIIPYFLLLKASLIVVRLHSLYNVENPAPTISLFVGNIWSLNTKHVKKMNIGSFIIKGRGGRSKKILALPSGGREGSTMPRFLGKFDLMLRGQPSNNRPPKVASHTCAFLLSNVSDCQD